MFRSATLMMLAALAAAACGGSSHSKTTPTGSTQASTGGGQQTAGPQFQHLVPDVSGAKAATSASVNAGTPVEVVVKVPANQAGRPLTIAIDQLGPATFGVTSTVAGTPLRQSGQIHVRGGSAQISEVRWTCVFPARSFCPVQAAAPSTSHVRLNIPKHPDTVQLRVLLDRPGASHQPTAASLGPPAPGHPVMAKLRLSSASGGSRGTTVTATPGGTVRVEVNIPPHSPAGGKLRIAIPNTSGQSIVVQAGGTAAKPSSTATITSSGGSIRIRGVSWRCLLPPATFCPFSAVHKTATGIEIALPTPHVATVELQLSIAKG
jgi:hypothetical protein